jgi:WD40 repeat protein
MNVMKLSAPPLVLVAIVALTLITAYLTIDTDNKSEPTATALPTPVASGFVVPPILTASIPPQRSPLTALPPAKWTPVRPSDTEYASDGNAFLLDLETGELYSPTERVLGHGAGALAGIAWMDNGEVSIVLLGTGGTVRHETAQYLGLVLGPMRKLPSGGLRVGNNVQLSSTGLLAFHNGIEGIVFDTVKGTRVGTLPANLGAIGRWSPDGRYLSLAVSTNVSPPRPPVISIWDTETGRVVDEMVGDSIGWSNRGHRFLYGAIDSADRGMQVSELRIRDVDTRAEVRILEASQGGYWSPNDRYILIDSHVRDEAGDKYSFRVYDVIQQRYLITLHGAWPESWLNDDRLAFTGNVCGTNDVFTIRSDGFGLRQVADSSGDPVRSVNPSPRGDSIAYSKARGIITIVSLTTGETREYHTGKATTPGAWSPDGRYLTMHVPAGKGGRCEFDPPQTLQIEFH